MHYHDHMKFLCSKYKLSVRFLSELVITPEFMAAVVENYP